MQHAVNAVPAAASRMRAIASGTTGAAAREALYAEFEPLVGRLVRRYSDGRDFKQDLEAEIYYHFCRLLDAYDPARGIPLRPYLVRNLAAAAYTCGRKYWRWQSRETSLTAGMIEAGYDHAWTVGHEDPSAAWDHRLVLEDLCDELRDAVRLLPPRQRQALVMRYYRSCSFEEIARVLAVRPATVRSLVRHAINNLRKQMGDRAAALD